jgi:hypothetical protein
MCHCFLFFVDIALTLEGIKMDEKNENKMIGAFSQFPMNEK